MSQPDCNEIAKIAARDLRQIGWIVPRKAIAAAASACRQQVEHGLGNLAVCQAMETAFHEAGSRSRYGG